MVADSDYQDNGLVMHAERSLTFGDGIHGDGKELPQSYERSISAIRVDSKEKYTAATANGFQSSERPKLKLLPRSKPLENIESPSDHQQVNL